MAALANTTKYKRFENVCVGPIAGNHEAAAKAQAWLDKYRPGEGWSFTGVWASEGGTSYIQVVKEETAAFGSGVQLSAEAKANLLKEVDASLDAANNQCYDELAAFCAASGAANAIPVPGAGLAADVAIIISMSKRFADVFEGAVDVGVLCKKVTKMITKFLLKQGATKLIKAKGIDVAAKQLAAAGAQIAKNAAANVGQKISAKILQLTGKDFAAKLAAKQGAGQLGKTLGTFGLSER